MNDYNRITNDMLYMLGEKGVVSKTEKDTKDLIRTLHSEDDDNAIISDDKEQYSLNDTELMLIKVFDEEHDDYMYGSVLGVIQGETGIEENKARSAVASLYEKGLINIESDVIKASMSNPGARRTTSKGRSVIASMEI